MKILVLLLAVLTPAPTLAITASELSATCQKSSNAVNMKGKFDNKRTDDIYASGQCDGFIEGWLQGVDQAVFFSGEKSVVITIKWDQLPKSMFTIANALDQYLKANPLESGKPADIVLIQVLRQSRLLSTTPYVSPTSTDATSVPARYKS